MRNNALLRRAVTSQWRIALLQCLVAVLAQQLLVAQTPTARDPNSLLSLEEEWHRENDWRDTSRLALHVNFHQAVNALNSVGATLDDGPYKWIAYFKGGVVAYEKAKRRYFMVYDPPDRYEWIMELRTIEPWIYMKAANSNPDWSVRFNKKTFVLERGNFEPNFAGESPKTQMQMGMAASSGPGVTQRSGAVNPIRTEDPFALLDQFAQLDQVRFQMQIRGEQPPQELLASIVRLDIQIRSLLLPRALAALKRNFQIRSAQANHLSNWDFDTRGSESSPDCPRCFRFHYLPKGYACDVIVQFGAEPVQDKARLPDAKTRFCFQAKNPSGE